MAKQGTFAGADAVELTTVSRGGFVESRHLGAAAVVDAEGEPLGALGDVRAPILPRSTLKFVQALASLEAGAPIEGEHLAIACGSHSGTPLHVALVRDVLERAGLDERALQCPPAWPIDSASRTALVRSGEPNAPIYMECSGKHAAMLAACVAAGWPIDDYLDPGHPLQQRIAETLARFSGERIAASAVDGCGAPVHAVSLLGLARAMARIASSQESSPFGIFRSAARVWHDARRHPWALAGQGRADTLIGEELGVLAKSGAEGVYVAVAPNGVSAAVKFLDGSGRGAPLVALQLLVTAGALDPDLAAPLIPRLGLEVLGGGRTVGHVSLGAGVPNRFAPVVDSPFA
ncbi:MAG: asparaginase [Microbacteriaceae bacterium]|nr:asparaginase [Microbacteriaceae bacterium]